ncbi:MAG: hypothetical protein ABSC64_02345 [Candidatus Korobacteraceae bacterium]
MKDKMKLPVTPKGHVLGYIRSPKHPDARRLISKKQEAALPASYVIPAVVDVIDQDGEGCCTACAFVGVNKMRSQFVTGSYFDGDLNCQYYWEREHDGTLSQGDVGSSITSAFWVGQTYGVAHGALDPDTSLLNTPPTAAQIASAEVDKTLTPQQLDATDETVTIANMKAAIYNNYPVQSGFTCYEGIDEVDSSGNLPMPSGNAIGGHSTMFFGWDDNHVNLDGSKGAMIVLNSWGQWGATAYGFPTGIFYMPYAYITDTDDAFGDTWAMIKQSDFPVVPNGPAPVAAEGSVPALAMVNGVMNIFYRGTDNAVWYRPVSGKGAGTSLGGILTEGVAAVGVGSNAYVFARGADKESTYYRTLVGTWVDLDGIATSAPTAVLNGTTIEVAVRGANTGVYVLTIDTTTGAISKWQTLGIETN